MKILNRKYAAKTKILHCGYKNEGWIVGKDRKKYIYVVFEGGRKEKR